MKNSLHFNYANISSRSMGVVQASLSSGTLEDIFLPNRSIRETKIPGRHKPYFQGFEYEPLNIPLTLYFEDGFGGNSLSQVANWIKQEFYKPFYFENYPNNVFYCVYEGDSKLMHNGISDGLVELNMRCDSPWSYSPVVTSRIYQLSTNPTEGNVINYINNGDQTCYPIIEINKVGDGGISITNLTNGGETFEFTGLLDGEKIYIDNDPEVEDIVTDLPGIFRYDNFNDHYLKMLVGVNRLLIKGKCTFQFKSEFILNSWRDN